MMGRGTGENRCGISRGLRDCTGMRCGLMTTLRAARDASVPRRKSGVSLDLLLNRVFTYVKHCSRLQYLRTMQSRSALDRDLDASSCPKNISQKLIAPTCLPIEPKRARVSVTEAPPRRPTR